MIKKADIILFAAIVILGLVFTFLIYQLGSGGSTVRVEVDGELYGTYSLNENQEISIKQNSHTNNITIKDGKVSMDYSDCKNQICVNHKEISKTNESITCLPNRVMVTIESGGNGGGYDAITE